MRQFFSYLTLVLLLILQTTLGAELAVFGVAPDLVLVFVLCRCLSLAPIPAAAFGMVAGLLLDMAGGRLMGFHGILMLYVGLGASIFGNNFFRGNLYVSIAAAFCVTVVYQLLYAFFNFIIFGGVSTGYLLLHIILTGAVYNALCALPLYYLSKRLGGEKRKDF